MVISERVSFVSPQEIVTPQSYSQEMTKIWHRVNAIQAGEEKSPQRNAANFDLWKLSETDTPITPDNYPSLARHGLLKTQQGVHGTEWQLAFPHLRDFWEIASETTFTYGYRIVQQAEFYVRLRKRVETMFPQEEMI